MEHTRLWDTTIQTAMTKPVDTGCKSAHTHTHTETNGSMNNALKMHRRDEIYIVHMSVEALMGINKCNGQ